MKGMIDMKNDTYEVKVIETGASRVFDTMEEVADWMRLVRKTFGCWDSKVTFEVVKVTRSIIKCEL